MSSLNRVTIIGNVTRDPEVRTFSNGGRVSNFSVATNESWKDKNTGEKKERVEYHRVSVVNDALVGIVERFVKKGTKVYLEGQLETRKYEKDGVEHYTTEVVLRPYRGSILLLGGKSSSGGGDDEYEHTDTAAQTPNTLADVDDEIPF